MAATAEAPRRIIVIAQPAEKFKGVIGVIGIKPRALDGSSADLQVEKLITDGSSIPKTDNTKPEYVLFNGRPKEFLNAAKTALRRIGGSAKGCFNSLTLIAPESKTPSDEVDSETGIRVRRIGKSETPFPPSEIPNKIDILPDADYY